MTQPLQFADVVIQAGQSVNFAGTASDPDGKIAKYWWFFPDGSRDASTKVNPGSIVFPETGVYVASLTAVDKCGTPMTRVRQRKSSGCNLTRWLPRLIVPRMGRP